MCRGSTTRPKPVLYADSFQEDGTGDQGAGTELDAVVATGVAGAGEEGTALGGGDGDTALGGGDDSEIGSQAVHCFPKLEAVMLVIVTAPMD